MEVKKWSLLPGQKWSRVMQCTHVDSWHGVECPQRTREPGIPYSHISINTTDKSIIIIIIIINVSAREQSSKVRVHRSTSPYLTETMVPLAWCTWTFRTHPVCSFIVSRRLRGEEEKVVALWNSCSTTNTLLTVICANTN